VSGRPLAGDPLFFEWSLAHTDDLFPVEAVRAVEPPPVPRSAVSAASLRYRFGGEERSMDDLIERTDISAIVVLRDSELVHEAYPGTFAAPDVRLRMFSVTKAVTSVLMGIALDEGLVKEVSDRIATYLPDFAHTSFHDATIFDLLNMSSGSAFTEAFDDPSSEIYRWRRSVTESDPREMARTLGKQHSAGEVFGYSSIDSAVLGWILEVASGMTLAQFTSRFLWQPMGASTDAYFYTSVREPRRHLAGSALCATVRDIARFGDLVRRGGAIDGRRVVSSEWIARFHRPERRHLRFGRLGPGLEDYAYSYKWWSSRRAPSALLARGIHGQCLYVDQETGVVIARAGSALHPEDAARDEETEVAFEQLSRAFSS
jgi:CubicO group peptidase (beta-lactamase class C family)